jgi:hypothetical protein
MDVRFIDPREVIWTAIGLELDAIGSMRYIDLPQADTEKDDDYRKRLIARMWESVEALTPAVATGEYIDKWRIENRAPEDTELRPNHVRDAVEANR